MKLVKIRTKKHNLLKDLTRIHNHFSVKEVEVVAYWCSLFFIFERKMAYWQEHLTHHIKGVYRSILDTSSQPINSSDHNSFL